MAFRARKRFGNFERRAPGPFPLQDGVHLLLSCLSWPSHLEVHRMKSLPLSEYVPCWQRPLFFERLNMVNRQPSNDQKFYRQPSKKVKFYRHPSNMQLLLAVKCSVKWYQGLSNLTISATHFWTAGSQRIVLTGTTSFHAPRFTVFSTHLLLN